MIKVPKLLTLLCRLRGSALKAVVKNVLKSSILILCWNLSACKSTDSLTLFNYGKIPNPGATAPSDPLVPPAVSDGLAINYANSIEIIMRCDATKSRITREVSATAQVGLAAFGGLGAAYNWSKTTLTVLGLGSAAIPQLQGIFDAKGRADVYNQAANMIQDGIWEYYSLNSSPSSYILTSNGLTLVKKVSAAISLVDNTLVGQLPSAKQMRQAVEEMTPAGATKQVAGAPPTNAMVPAALQRAPMEALNARIDAAMAMKSNREQHISASQAAEQKARQDEILALLPAITAFNEFKDQIEENNGHDPTKNQASYAALLNDKDVKASGVPAMNPDVNEINQFLRGKAAQKPTEAQKKAIVAAASRLAKNK